MGMTKLMMTSRAGAKNEWNCTSTVCVLMAYTVSTCLYRQSLEEVCMKMFGTVREREREGEREGGRDVLLTL